MSRLWRRQRRPVLLASKFKLIFSLASAVTFTSLPPRRLALDIPPVAFFIPGGDQCVHVSVHLCLKQHSFQHLSKQMHLGGLEKSPAARSLCGEACDSDWRINLNPLLRGIQIGEWDY